MSKWKLEYNATRIATPISYWVHKGLGEDEKPYNSCTEFSPPFPKKDVMKGYPRLMVTVLSFKIQFASKYEVEHFLSVMKQKNLPTTMSLSNKRDRHYGPNTHWLSRFPAHLKSWKKREIIISAVSKAMQELEASKYDF